MSQLKDLFLNQIDPGEGQDQVFQEPWQAQAFAITHLLAEHNIFSWNDWTAAFSARNLENLRPDASNYFDLWVHALESLLVERGVTVSDTVEALADSWARAAHATPHGKSILLENDPLRPH